MNARKPARKKAEEEQLLADVLQAFEETVTTPATLLSTEPKLPDGVHADAEICQWQLKTDPPTEKVAK